ncbi:MAG: amidohydrolase family protein [Gemmataceae bacterium]
MTSLPVTHTFTARWILPGGAPPLERGTLTIVGDRVLAVEPRGVRTADVDFGECAILPGFVNAHTHLDLTGAAGLARPVPGAPFPDWLRSVVAYRRGPAGLGESVETAIASGIRELHAAGTTLVGDISATGASWNPLSGGPMRATVYAELLGLNEAVLNERWRRAVEEPVQPATPNCRWGFSPHAPYSVNFKVMRRMRSFGTRLATHIAESASEAELLTHQQGPFVEFLTDLGVYEPAGLAPSWEEFLAVRSALPNPSPTAYIHANFLPVEFPFGPHDGVVYCPRTHAAFGHPPHPFRSFLARGVPVALGTDSRASNPDLDVFAEAQAIWQEYPDFPGETLLQMLTQSGADLLGWGDQTGALLPGRSADFVVLPLERSADPYQAVWGADRMLPRRVFISGAEI